MKNFIAVLVMVGIMFTTMPVFGQGVVVRPMTPMEKFDYDQRSDIEGFKVDILDQLGLRTPIADAMRGKKVHNGQKKQTAAKSNQKKLRDFEGKVRQKILENHIGIYKHVRTMFINKDTRGLEKWWALAETKNNSPIDSVYGAYVFLVVLDDVGIGDDPTWQKFVTRLTIRVAELRNEKEKKILDREKFENVLVEIGGTGAEAVEKKTPDETHTPLKRPVTDNEVI